VDVFEHLEVHSGRRREFLTEHREHAGDVGVGLGERDARPEARDGLVTEVADEDFAAVVLQRHGQGGLVIHEAEGLWQDTNDLARFGIDLERASDCARIAAKPALPVAVKQHHGFCAAGRVVLFGEGATQRGLDA
jgi:hypothetical protein